MARAPCHARPRKAPAASDRAGKPCRRCGRMRCAPFTPPSRGSLRRGRCLRPRPRCASDIALRREPDIGIHRRYWRADFRSDLEDVCHVPAAVPAASSIRICLRSASAVAELVTNSRGCSDSLRGPSRTICCCVQAALPTLQCHSVFGADSGAMSVLAVRHTVHTYLSAPLECVFAVLGAIQLLKRRGGRVLAGIVYAAELLQRINITALSHIMLAQTMSASACAPLRIGSGSAVFRGACCVLWHSRKLRTRFILAPTSRKLP